MSYEQSPEVKFRLAFFLLQKLRFLGRLWTDLATILGDLLSKVKLTVYQISANLVHIELRNVTFEGELCQPQLHFRTLIVSLVTLRLKHFSRQSFSLNVTLTIFVQEHHPHSPRAINREGRFSDASRSLSDVINICEIGDDDEDTGCAKVV